MDPVGREDRTKDPTSENYDENILSENSAKTLSSEDCDEEEFNCPWVADTRLSKARVAELILATINDRQGDLTWVINAPFILKYCDVVTSVKTATRRLVWERECRNTVIRDQEIGSPLPPRNTEINSISVATERTARS